MRQEVGEEVGEEVHVVEEMVAAVEVNNATRQRTPQNQGLRATNTQHTGSMLHSQEQTRSRAAVPRKQRADRVEL